MTVPYVLFSFGKIINAFDWYVSICVFYDIVYLV